MFTITGISISELNTEFNTFFPLSTRSLSLLFVEELEQPMKNAYCQIFALMELLRQETGIIYPITTSEI